MKTQEEKLDEVKERALSFSNGWGDIANAFLTGAMSPEAFEYWKDSPEMDKYNNTKLLRKGLSDLQEKLNPKELSQIEMVEKDLGSLDFDLTSEPIVENKEDTEAQENYIFAMYEGFRGYRNKITDEWISEIVYQNRFED